MIASIEKFLRHFFIFLSTVQFFSVYDMLGFRGLICLIGAIYAKGVSDVQCS